MKKKLHPDEHKELCRESDNSSRVVFIPGKTTTPIVSDGPLKSLDPPCLLFSQSDGKHLFTCIKSKNNHKFCEFVKDIGSNLINNLGQVSYSLFQNILVCQERLVQKHM